MVLIRLPISVGMDWHHRVKGGRQERPVEQDDLLRHDFSLNGIYALEIRPVAQQLVHDLMRHCDAR